ncbi:MAG: hypothetical protein JSV44_12140 [Candidatus Zixiibacteriota bacterium]|nr:MAG: hypothetical protein JSV44_12140 [candidate division Zixibacteria bacterium]
MKAGRWIYALALLLMPLTYSTKFLLGMPDITWVNPTALLGILLFFLLLPAVRPSVTLLIIVSTVISACLGFIFLLNLGGDQGRLYTVFREPVRAALNFVWFWVTIYFVRYARDYLLKWLAVSVVVQLAIAVYLWLGAMMLVPLPAAADSFMQAYAYSQLAWFSDLPVVRLGGTFIESPPFGLFMLSAFVILSLAFLGGRKHSSWLIAGWIAALVGVIGSLATQVLLGFAVFAGLCLIFVPIGRQAAGVRIFGVLLMLVIIPYLFGVLSDKVSGSADMRAKDAYAESGGERLFHMRYGLRLLVEHPEYLPFGLGPGRYGRYAKGTGIFPVTVTPQVTLVEWLVEYGLIGTFLIGWWLWVVGKNARGAFGVLGVAAFAGLLLANMFQANWKWEAWFMAMAVLYASDLPSVGSDSSSGKAPQSA